VKYCTNGKRIALLRFYSALILGLVSCASIAPLHAAETGVAGQSAPPDASPAQPGNGPAPKKAVTPEAEMRKTPSHARSLHSGLNTVSAFSLEPETADAPLIRQASLTVRAQAPASHDGFTEAPLPDDSLDAPKERGGDDDTKLRPDFFQRNHHQVGDALAGGAGANDQRRGHGSMAAGVAVAIPMD